MDAESNEITVSYINILELTTLFFIIFIIIISHYSITSTIFSPILIFIALFVTRYLKYKRHCVGEVPVNNLISRCCILLCIYLYSHYTVKCVPLLNLIFSKLFEFPLTGKIFRGIFAYLLTYLGNEIIYKYNKKDDEIDELLGLKLGADDFVKKSGGFSIKVLIERIRVQLRKKDTKDTIEENKSIISHGKLKLDPSQLECEWNGKQLPDKLTTTEFLLVKELAKRPGIIKERSQLMDIAYREDTDIEDRTIDSHVKRIRKKFKKVDNNFSAIETRYGSGYRWNTN